MCKNATNTAASLMAAIEPDLVNLLNLLNVSKTPDGAAAINAFNAAQAALAAWTPGTTAQTVVEALNAFTAVFDVLPIPEDAKALANVIDAGIVTIIAVITANSPAPAPAAGSTAGEEHQALHALSVAEDATAKVSKLVPGFKRSHFHGAAHQYKQAWNGAVTKAGPKYAQLKQGN
jgi:hypothetical protein